MKPFKAFTLIETLVAVSILLMALVGPLTIAAQSLRSAYYARDQVTAFYLAQEGIEYVRAVRDQNYIGNQSWLTGISECQGALCTVDFPNFTHQVCPNNICSPVLVSSTGGLFNQTTGTASKFTRAVTITPVPGASDEMIISVTVSWTSTGINRTFSLKERIFNWL